MSRGRVGSDGSDDTVVSVIETNRQPSHHGSTFDGFPLKYYTSLPSLVLTSTIVYILFFTNTTTPPHHHATTLNKMSPQIQKPAP
jgi:hypothetical protein